MESRRPRLGWRGKFAVAFRGLGVAVRGESSFCVHFVATLIAVMALVTFECSPGEWAVILVVVGLVYTAELMNTAIEILFRGFDQPTRDRVYPALDVSAGAVLAASLAAVVVGIAVFGPKLWMVAGR